MREFRSAMALVALGLLATAFVGVVPTAAAAAPTLTMTLESQTADEQLKPLQAPIQLAGTVTLTAEAFGPAPSMTGITVSLTAKEAPPWATVVINPPQVVMTFAADTDSPAGAATASDTKEFDVLVSASDLAPAFQEGTIVIEAVSSAVDPTLERGTASARASVRASYFSIIDVALPESIRVDRPQTPVSFPISVTNLGNGPTKVSFELLTQPVDGDKMQVSPPQSLTLEARQTGGSQITKEAVLQVQTPFKNGYMNEPRSIVLKVTSHYATDTQLQGASETVTMLVTTKGFYVPGPDPLLLVGLVGAAAAFVRRWRG